MKIDEEDEGREKHEGREEDETLPVYEWRRRRPRDSDGGAGEDEPEEHNGGCYFDIRVFL